MTLIQLIRKAERIGPGEVCVVDADLDFIGYIDRVTEDGGDVLFHLKEVDDSTPTVPDLTGPALIRELRGLLTQGCQKSSELVFRTGERAAGRWGTAEAVYEEEGEDGRPALMIEIAWRA